MGSEDRIRPELDKAIFEHRLILASKDYIAFNASTLRMLSLKPVWGEEEEEDSLSSAPAAAPIWGSGGSEFSVQDVLASYSWLPWIACLATVVPLLLACVAFRLRKQGRGKCDASFDGIHVVPNALPIGLDSKTESAFQSLEWRENFVARANVAFEPSENEADAATFLRLAVGEVIRVEAGIGEAWFYGHTLCAPEKIGFFPQSLVERIGLQRTVVQQPPPLPVDTDTRSVPHQGLNMRVARAFSPDEVVSEEAGTDHLLTLTWGEDVEVLFAASGVNAGWLYGRQSSSADAVVREGYFPEDRLA